MTIASQGLCSYAGRLLNRTPGEAPAARRAAAARLRRAGPALTRGAGFARGSGREQRSDIRDQTREDKGSG